MMTVSSSSSAGNPEPRAHRTSAERLIEYAAFLAEHDRTPSGELSAPREERSLSKWSSDILYAETRSDKTLRVRRELVALRTPYGSFERNASALEAFVLKAGRRPRKSEEPHLAAWVVGQRMKHRRGELSVDRVERLLAIPGVLSDFTFNRDGAPRRSASERLSEYAEFVATHNRLPRKSSSAPEAERSLEKWTDAILYGETQREEILRVRRELVALRAPYGSFERNASATEAFVLKTGRRPYRSEDPQLTVWLGGQRTKYLRGQLSGDRAERVERLLAIPGALTDVAVSRNAHDQVSRRQRLDEYTAFVAEHGRVPGWSTSADQAELRLSGWANFTLRRQSGSEEGAEIRQSLVALRASVGVHEDGVEGMSNPPRAASVRLSEYADFLTEHNRTPSGASSAPEEERKLNQWAINFLGRDTQNEEILKLRRRLAALREPYELFWRNIPFLEAFVGAHGRTPRKPDDPSLALWLVTQRAKYRKGDLTDDRIERLRRIPGALPASMAGRQELLHQAWESNFGAYAAWVGEKGIPRRRSTGEEYRLAGWLNTQRANERAGRLRPEYVERLLTIPGSLKRD
jgi:hypothetical protein